MLALCIYYFMMTKFDKCQFTRKIKGKHTMCTHVYACGSRVTAIHIWFVMCRLSTVTLIVEKYT